MENRKHLRIGIDGQALQGKKTGVGRYVFELCKELDRLIPDATFFVYSREAVELPVVSDRWVARIDNFPYKKLAKPWIKFRGTFLCKKDNLDVFWGGTSFLPFLSKKTFTVTTVHDLNYKIVPETMSFSALMQFKAFFKRDILKADKVICVSEGSSDRLYKYVGRKADAIVSPAISPLFKPANDQMVQVIKGKFQLNHPYILAVATFEPRKNLELLVKTFAEMKLKGDIPNYDLVLVGGKGWRDERLVELISNDKTNSIKPLGYVDDQDLPSLYTGADLFAFPSIYEGFGMPVLEARGCGTMVIATDIPELREAGGDDIIYIQPTKDGIWNGILKAISIEKNEAENLRERTWRESAKIMSSVMLTSIGHK